MSCKERWCWIRLVVILCATGAGRVHGQSIVAFTRPSATSTAFLYTSLDPLTGLGTSISPTIATPVVGALGVTTSGQFYGTIGTGFYLVDVLQNSSNVINPVISPGVAQISAFDIMSDNRAFGLTSVQLYSIQLSDGVGTPIGAADAIDAAVVAAGAAASPRFVQGLGSVGSSLYATELRSGSLLEINPDTGEVTVVGGSAGLLLAGNLADGTPRSRYSGFSALTGVDLNRDGQYETLMGAVNLYDDDGVSTTANLNIGGLVQYDLATGQWEFVGKNPGQAFSGMASVVVPEPTVSLGLAALLLGTFSRRQRRRNR